MMPNQFNTNDWHGAATVPEAELTTTRKTSLRTYSRHSLNRRHTSTPALEVKRVRTRTESLTLAGQDAAKQLSADNNPHPRLPTANAGRKRLRFSLTFAEDRRPNDLAWEALASSAPVLTQKDDSSAMVGVPCETRVVECSPNHSGAEGEHQVVEDAMDGESSRLAIESTDEGETQEKCLTEGREGKPRGKAALETGPENVSLGKSDTEDDSSDVSRDGEFVTTVLTSSSESDGFSISATAGSQKPRGRNRFLIFDRSPPKGFKVLHKPRVNPETDSPVMKKRKKLTDGFTEDEARPIFLGKRRRLQHLDINVGSLDLTQNGGASQQRQRDRKPGVEKRTRPRTAANLRGRQYFSASRFQTGSQDSTESCEVKNEPMRSQKHELNIQILGVDSLIPRTDSPQPEYTAKPNSPGEALGELVRNSSPVMQLPPKRIMDGNAGKSGSLRLRPGPLD